MTQQRRNSDTPCKVLYPVYLKYVPEVDNLIVGFDLGLGDDILVPAMTSIPWTMMDDVLSNIIS